MDDYIVFDAFCNISVDGPLWSDSLTLNSFEPNFTTCFQYTILYWIPLIWLLLSMPFKIYSLVSAKTRFPACTTSGPLLLKTVLILLLIIVVFFNVLKYIEEAKTGSIRHGLAFVLSPCLLIVGLVYVIVLMHYEFRKGFNSGGTLFTFWLLEFLAFTVFTASGIEQLELFEQQTNTSSAAEVNVSNQYFQVDPYRFGIALVSYVLVIAIAFTNLFADNKGVYAILGIQRTLKQYTNLASSSIIRVTGDAVVNVTSRDQKSVEKPKKLSPEIFSSFLNRVTFFWFTKTTLIGFKRALTLDDCWELIPRYRSNKVVPTVIASWEQQLQKTVDKQREYVKKNSLAVELSDNNNARILVPDDARRMSYHVERSSSPTENLMALRTMHSHVDVKKKFVPSVAAALVGVCGKLLLQSAISKLVHDVITLSQPLLLSALITVIVEKGTIQWHGYVLAFLIFVAGAFRSLLIQQFYHHGLMCGLNARTALTGLIFRKSLRLSAAGKKESTVGEIVNLMSVDVQRIQDALPFFNMLWSSPFMIGVAVALLKSELGDAAFAGLGVILLIVPINVLLTGRVKRLQVEQMNHKDERIKLTTEVLNGMKVLKLYGWEMAYRKVIDEIRQREVLVLKRMGILQAITSTSVFGAPFLVGATCFAVFTNASICNILTPQIAFVSLSLVNTMSGPLTFFPQVLALTVQGVISLRRIRDFLLSEELVENSVTYDAAADDPVKVDDATFSWGRAEAPFLQQIDMKIKERQLVAVVGSVGSGKSSLLHALLGEMHKVSGNVTVCGRIAYAPQQAWLVNATVQENITFGQPFDKEKYDRVIKACALETDLKILGKGDQTEIGERGINMSGGQKQRISLARAVYQDLDIYVLDDVLSAVDAHVAKHLFDHVLGPNGLLASKTRILVTHAVNILPKVDYIVVMKDGCISEKGSFEQLLQQKGGFADLVKEFLLEEEEEEEEEEEGAKKDEEAKAFRTDLLRKVSVLVDEKPTDVRNRFERQSSVRRSRKQSKQAESRANVTRTVSVAAEDEEEGADQLMTTESAAEGNVRWAVYAAYLKALGTALAIVFLTCYVVYVGLGVGSSIWLSAWSAETVNATKDVAQNQGRIDGYFGLGGAQLFMLLVHAISFSLACTRASRVLHDEVFGRIVRSPMSFFDTTPLGRITNRLSKDLDTVDIMMPLTSRTWLITMCTCLVTIILTVMSNWLLLFVVLPLIFAFILLQRFYIRTSRQIKRIDSILRSPIFAHFQTSLIGTVSIRAYKIVESFVKKSDELVDQSSRAYYPQCIAFRWLGVSVDALNNVMLLVVAMASVATREQNETLASLAVTYTMTLTLSLNLMVRAITDLETYIVSIERLKEYSEIPTEAPLEDLPGAEVPDKWPTSGKVEFANYSVRYRPGLDMVLRDINCVINPGEKVGIVGRTGAGKSSLSLALFRILEPAQGTIIVDGVDITKIGLQKLRGRITIIPQEPVLFSGSLRRNIDPFGSYWEDQIWQALDCANLKTFVESQPAKLEFMCSEGGENLSVGQRQLLCMARAVLRRSKILLLDEATAAVDVETDQLIQKTIRDEFKDCTILTIAHRLNTVIDYDKIMVLDRGMVKEYDTPSNLLNDKNSQFYSMAKNAGIVHD